MPKYVYMDIFRYIVGLLYQKMIKIEIATTDHSFFHILTLYQLQPPKTPEFIRQHLTQEVELRTSASRTLHPVPSFP